MNFINYNTNCIKQKKEDILYLNTFRSRTQPLEGYTIFKGYSGYYYSSYTSKKKIPQINDYIIGVTHYQNIDTSKPNFILQTNCCKFFLKEEEALDSFCRFVYNRNMKEILSLSDRVRNRRIYIQNGLIFKVLLNPEDILAVNKYDDESYDCLSIMTRKLIVASKKLSFKILSRKYITENNNRET